MLYDAPAEYGLIFHHLLRGLLGEKAAWDWDRVLLAAITTKNRKNRGERVMFKKLMIGILLTGISGLSGVATMAQAASGAQSTPAPAPDGQAMRDQDIALLRKDIRGKRKQLIAANLTLTGDQATRFWPVYEQYINDLVKINNEKYAVIKDYADQWGTMTDVQAESLIKRSLAVDEQVAQLRIRYVPIFEKVVPATVTASFFQIDRRVQSMIDLQLASQLPLVQAQN
jgi:hypothetical protein